MFADKIIHKMDSFVPSKPIIVVPHDDDATFHHKHRSGVYTENLHDDFDDMREEKRVYSAVKRPGMEQDIDNDTSDDEAANEEADPLRPLDDGDAGEDEPNNIHNYTDNQKLEMFWRIIAGFNWCNKSDMEINRDHIRRQLANMSTLHQEIFESQYPRLHESLSAILSDRFAQLEVSPEKQSMVTGHIIALGEDWFNTVIAGGEIIDYIIESDEYQDFHGIAKEVVG